MYSVSLRPKAIPAPFCLDDTHAQMTIHSQGMMKVREQIQRLAHIQYPTLITGETGVGKELCAKEIHSLGEMVDQSKPFVAVNCAAIPKNLLHTELFGCVSGAFTGSKKRPGLIRCADGGTLFLDEIGELSLESQASLLRVLESGEVRAVGSEYTKKVRFRLLSATHKDLPHMISQDLFRADLYHRISTMNLHIPPLRERMEDIQVLLSKFAPSACQRMTKGAWDLLYNHPWLGNVRELKNIALRLDILVPNGRIFSYHINDILYPVPPAKSQALHEENQHESHVLLDTSLSLKKHIKFYVREVLLEQQGNITNTANVLGINRSTVYRYLEACPKKDKTLQVNATDHTDILDCA